MLPGQTETGILNQVGEAVSNNSDTQPPGPDFSDHPDLPNSDRDFELSPEERKIERDARITEVFNKVLPKVKDLKIGYDPRQPWLSNPHLDATVKATIEVLYDLQVSNRE